MKKYLMILILLTVASNIYSQKGMKDYEYSCYCTLRYLNPSSLIEEGNNWELLVALKTWKTIEELDEIGINYSLKQLEILQALNFVEKQKNKYKTLITILNYEETIKLREQTKEIATSIVKEIQTDYALFLKMVKEQGFENNTYTLFFSYIMDNIVWRKFEENDILPKRDINVENPIWDGTVWFNYPKRQFECGTNSISFGENMIASTNWTKISELSLKEIVDYKVMLKDLMKNSKITDTLIIKTLFQHDICDKNGELQVPFIKNDNTLPFNINCNNIAEKIYNYLINKVDFLTINENFNIKSKGDAIIIIYHDIMWDILEVLEENGQIKKPKAFAHPENSNPTDLKDIFFIYEK